MNENVVKSLEFVEMEEKSQILFLITEKQINIYLLICTFVVFGSKGQQRLVSLPAGRGGGGEVVQTNMRTVTNE